MLTCFSVPCRRIASRCSSVVLTPLIKCVKTQTSPKTWSACMCVMKIREMLATLSVDCKRRLRVPSAQSKTDHQYIVLAVYLNFCAMLTPDVITKVNRQR